MDVLVRAEPAPNPHTTAQAAAEPSDAEIRKIASLVLTQTMMGVEDIAHDSEKHAPNHVEVSIEQVYRAKDRDLYSLFGCESDSSSIPGNGAGRICSASYRAAHLARKPQKPPDHLTDVRGFQSQTGIEPSRLSRRNSVARDLAPGEKTTGVISIGISTGNAPQIYQLNFGADQSGPLKVEAVL